MLPVATAHGEGRALFSGQELPQSQIALQYVDAAGLTTMDYPQNPKGSPAGITALSGNISTWKSLSEKA